jgi:hypothetical protein
MSPTKTPQTKAAKVTRRPRKSNRKLSEGTLTERTLRFLLTVLEGKGPYQIDAFGERWGGRPGIYDICAVLNRVWLEVRGVPLVEFVDRDGNVTKRGRFALRLKDQDFGKTSLANLTVLAAMQGFLGTLAGTHFEEAISSMLSRLGRDLSHKDQAFLCRASKKYRSVPSSGRSYHKQADLLNELNRALLYEKVVTLTLRSGESASTSSITCTPLAFVQHDGELLLAYCNAPREAGEVPKWIAVEQLTAVRCHRDEGFPYPMDWSLPPLRGEGKRDTEKRRRERSRP